MKRAAVLLMKNGTMHYFFINFNFRLHKVWGCAIILLLP